MSLPEHIFIFSEACLPWLSDSFSWFCSICCGALSMTIEVSDLSVPPAEHVCTTGEECDIHRAKRWIAGLKSSSYPDADLEAAYLLLTQEARLVALSANTITLYQVALTVLVRRAGGHISIPSEEASVCDGTLLNPDINHKTGEITFGLTTMDDEVANAKARVSKTEALEEALKLGSPRKMRS